MTDKVTEAISHNYEPVNKYIDDQARLKRSASSWRYAKATALLMVAAGILAVLLAWAYYLYKKPHRLTSLSEIEEKVLKNEERLINNERRLPSEEEIQSDTLNNQLQDKINEKDQEILDLKKQLEQNPKNEILKQEKENLEKEKENLQEKLDQQNKVQTDVIHFKYIETTLKDQKVIVYTRLEYDDPRDLNPTKVSCYISFLNPDYPNIELGNRSDEVFISNYLRNEISINDQDVRNIKSNFCQYNYE